MGSLASNENSAEGRMVRRDQTRIACSQKSAAVLRVLRGETAHQVSDEVGVSIRRLERWRDDFVAAGTAELGKRKSRGSRGWLATHAPSIAQWLWLLLALVAVISVLAIFLARGTEG